MDYYQEAVDFLARTDINHYKAVLTQRSHGLKVNEMEVTVFLILAGMQEPEIRDMTYEEKLAYMYLFL